MTLTRKLILILTLTLAITAGAVAQETQTQAATTETTTTTAAKPARTATEAVPEAAGKAAAREAAAGEEASSEDGRQSVSSYELRNQFTAILRTHPPEVASILALDPTLLSNENYMSAYPALAEFVAAHPEMQRNPRFYLGEFQERPRPRETIIEDLVETLTILATVGLIAFALSWLVRTIIEQKRWNRLSRTQTEVHNKILDRFSTSEELLAYVKSPAGTKFLESAPIPVRAAQQPTPQTSAPMSRILWSLQVGAGVAVGAAGMLLLSLRFSGETGEGIFVLGAIAFCVGAGFIASAIVSLVLSRRLGLWSEAESAAGDSFGDSGAVR